MSNAPLPNQTITSNEMKNFESIEIENDNIKYLLKFFNNMNNNRIFSRKNKFIS